MRIQYTMQLPLAGFSTTLFNSWMSCLKGGLASVASAASTEATLIGLNVAAFATRVRFFASSVAEGVRSRLDIVML